MSSMSISTSVHASIGTPASEIIIVDDNEEWRDGLAAILELEGYLVTGFSDGKTFLDEAVHRTPICTFLDVCMPGPSGLDVLEKLADMAYQAPIFLISARVDAPVVLEGMRNGAFGVIEKPFDPYTAVLRVRQAADLWAQRTGVEWPPFAGGARLTRQECAMLAQIAAGSSNEEAARNLGISLTAAAKCRADVKRSLEMKELADLKEFVDLKELAALLRNALDEIAKARQGVVNTPVAINAAARSLSREKKRQRARSRTVPVTRSRRSPLAGAHRDL